LTEAGQVECRLETKYSYDHLVARPRGKYLADHGSVRGSCWNES